MIRRRPVVPLESGALALPAVPLLVVGAHPAATMARPTPSTASAHPAATAATPSAVNSGAAPRPVAKEHVQGLAVSQRLARGVALDLAGLELAHSEVLRAGAIAPDLPALIAAGALDVSAPLDLVKSAAGRGMAREWNVALLARGWFARGFAEIRRRDVVVEVVDWGPPLICIINTNVKLNLRERLWGSGELQREG